VATFAPSHPGGFPLITSMIDQWIITIIRNPEMRILIILFLIMLLHLFIPKSTMYIICENCLIE